MNSMIIIATLASPLLLFFVLAWFLQTQAQKWHKRQSSRRRHVGSTVRYGEEGEQLVRHQLQFLGREYVAIHDIVINGGGQRQQVDHIVIGPNGVFHIETKHWSGKVEFDQSGMRHVKHGKVTGDPDPTAQMHRHDYVLRSVLHDNDVSCDLVGILCFSHPSCNLDGRTPSYLTVRLDRLLDVIKSHRPHRSLSPQQVDRIIELISRHSRRTPVGYGTRV